MGSNTIVAIVVGAILVIVGFSLWPVLNGASNSLFSYFRDSCDDGNGNRFLQAYAGTTNTSNLVPIEYSTQLRQHGGPGQRITANGADCRVIFVDDQPVPEREVPVDDTLNVFLDASTNAGAQLSDLSNAPVRVYSEQGDVIGTVTNDDIIVLNLGITGSMSAISEYPNYPVSDIRPEPGFRIRIDFGRGLSLGQGCPDA